MAPRIRGVRKSKNEIGKKEEVMCDELNKAGTSQDCTSQRQGKPKVTRKRCRRTGEARPPQEDQFVRREKNEEMKKEEWRRAEIEDFSEDGKNAGLTTSEDDSESDSSEGWSSHIEKRGGFREEEEALALRDELVAVTGVVGIAPRVPLRVGEQVITALVDTGASVNLIRTDLVHELEQVPVDIALCLILHDTSTKARSSMDLEANLGGMSVNLHMLGVDDLREEAILGRPFLEENDVVIDWKRRTIAFGVQRRHIVYWGENKAIRTALTPDELYDLIQDKVPEERRQDYLEEILKNADVFSEEPIPATTRTTQHKIVLRDSIPVRVPPFKTSEEKKRKINEACQEMLAQGVIRRSRSDYNSPVLLVKKKDGDQRFCVDYRLLNAKTEAEVGHLPPISDTIRELGDARYFTTLDLKAGYWQVPMAEESKKYTAFSTQDGQQFEFEVMPFGLTGAPGTFQKLMAAVLEGYVHDFVKVYLDDIVIYSRTHDEHLYHIGVVLERLREHGLHVAPGKCSFGATRIDYLGHTITANCNEPQAHHLKKIQEYPVPRTVRELRAFLGTAGWLREYVPRFAEIAAPLTDVLEGNKGFRWTARQQVAFEELKDALANHAELHRPLPGVRYNLQTDASSIGMGSVLFQFDPDDPGKRRLIACASAKFTKTETRYHVNEQELLAVVWGVKKFRNYLEDQHFDLYTDSRALLWLNRYKDEKSKLMRWALMLQAYSFTVIHVPGRYNELPDFLSRNPEQEERQEEPEEVDDRAYPINMVEQEPEEASEDERDPQQPEEEQDEAERQDQEEQPGEPAEEPPEEPPPGPLFDLIVQEQRQDHACRLDRVRLHLAARNGPQNAEEARAARRYFVEDDLIWRRKRHDRRTLLVPPHMTGRVLQEYHDSPLAAHPGRDETLLAIRRMYDWPGQAKQVKRYVRACLICASSKANRQPAAPLRPRNPDTPWRAVSLDVLGPYPKTSKGNEYIIVLVDLFSKWVEAKATPRGTQTEILEFLDEVTARWGHPESIITDCGAQFRGNRWERYLAARNIAHYTTPIFHQRANPVERRVQELKKILRTTQTAPNKWDRKLQEALFTLRNRSSAATGQAPAELILGAVLPRPGEWTVPATVRPPPDRTAQARQQRIEQARARQTVYVRNLYPEPREAGVGFRPGQQVMVKEYRQTGNPFQAKWTGPHEIITRHGDNTYTVERDGLHVKLHIDDLRPPPPEADE